MSSKTYHFVGVGGIGMSAIARILLARGEAVSGSDLKSTPLIETLRREGVRVVLGHAADNVELAHTVVVSSAIDRRNPEYAAAQRLGLPLLHRGEMLARLLHGRQGIAVCGTHGKTTTTAMTHAVLRGGGIDAGLVLGGIDGLLDTNAQNGSASWFVTEADESDGSFALLAPAMAILTNIENDHLACDDELPQLVRAFAEFLSKLPASGTAIIGIDNPLSASLAAHAIAARIVTFGLAPQSDVAAVNLRFVGLRSAFDVIAGGVCLGTVELNVPGSMNVQNALAAIAAARELSVPFARIAAALRAFRGVRRRFDILAKTSRMVVVDDYAHHPTAIAATIAAARACHRGSIVVAFQPHRYTRTAYLANEFAKALRDADYVYLTPIYAASEPALPGVSERSIGEPLAAFGTPVGYVATGDLEERVLRETPTGAMLLLLGAGDVTDVAAALADRIARPAAVGA